MTATASSDEFQGLPGRVERAVRINQGDTSHDQARRPSAAIGALHEPSSTSVEYQTIQLKPAPRQHWRSSIDLSYPGPILKMPSHDVPVKKRSTPGAPTNCGGLTGLPTRILVAVTFIT